LRKPNLKAFDWRRLARVLTIVAVAFAVLPFTMNVLGMAGQIVMTILDGAMGSRISATNPALTWAVVGACAGITPALWSLPTFRRRRALVLLIPGSAMLILCVLGLLVGTPATPRQFPLTQPAIVR